MRLVNDLCQHGAASARAEDLIELGVQHGRFALEHRMGHLFSPAAAELVGEIERQAL